MKHRTYRRPLIRLLYEPLDVPPPKPPVARATGLSIAIAVAMAALGLSRVIAIECDDLCVKHPTLCRQNVPYTPGNTSGPDQLPQGKGSSLVSYLG